MRLNLNRNIYSRLRENSFRNDNQLSIQDEKKLANIIESSLVGNQLMCLNYDINPFKLGLLLSNNLPNELSSVFDSLQTLIGQGTTLFDSKLKQNIYYTDLERNTKSLLRELTKYLHKYEFDSDNSLPLINVKLKAFVKNIENNIHSFLSSFIMKLKSNERVHYNQFSILWIYELILHDDENKLIDQMDIKLIKDKLVNCLIIL